MKARTDFIRQCIFITGAFFYLTTSNDKKFY